MTKGVTWHQAQEKSLKHTSTAQDWMIHFHYLDFHIDVLIKKLQRNELLPFCTQTPQTLMLELSYIILSLYDSFCKFRIQSFSVNQKDLRVTLYFEEDELQ